MKYDKATIKQFIEDFSKHNHVVEYDETFELDEFFSLSDNVQEMQLNEMTSHQVLYNELDQLIYTTCTEKEYIVFMLLCEGKSFQQIARVFELTTTRIRQIYNTLLNKLESMG